MNHIGGKLLMFQHGVPSVGVGKLKARENLALYGTEREPTLRNPEDPFFKRFAAEACRVQMTLDLFVGSGNYTDLASLVSIPRYTCGQVGEASRLEAWNLMSDICSRCFICCQTQSISVLELADDSLISTHVFSIEVHMGLVPVALEAHGLLCLYPSRTRKPSGF